MKRWIGLVLLLSTFAVAPAWAEHEHGGDDKQCTLKDGKCPHGSDCNSCDKKKEECGCPIIAKIAKKSAFFLKNSAEIGLTDDQVASIKALKLENEKASIMAKAGMEAGKLDFEAKLSEPKLDVDGLNQMIDAGMAQMATGAKESVARYAKLKAVLSEEQMKKAKELWKKQG